jgi:hypothetical protein
VTLEADGRLTGVAGETGTFVLEIELCDDGVPLACVTRPLTITVDAVVGNTPPPPGESTPQLIDPPGPVELDQLPFTGMDSGVLLVIAAMLMGLGALVLRSARSEP